MIGLYHLNEKRYAMLKPNNNVLYSMAGMHNQGRLKILSFAFLILISQNLFAALKADFTVSPTAGCSPLIVQFKDASTGSPTSRIWHFGNGNSSTQTNPGAIYYNPGTYDVTLIVRDGSGNVDSITKTALVTVYSPPIAGFLGRPTKGCLPVTVYFDDSCKKGDGKLTSWIWDFGDGHVSTKQWPNNTYLTAGSYTVSLIVKDTNGCQSTLIKKDYININAPVNAKFSASDSESCKAPFSNTYTSTVSGGAGGTYNYTWNFGDGGKSNLGSPTYKYNTGGAYTVTLTVTDSAGCQDTFVKSNFIKIGNAKVDFRKAGSFTVKLFVKVSSKCVDSIVKTNVIVIKQGPTAIFTAQDTSFCKAPGTTTFKDTSINAVGWAWDFGDGKKSSLKSPTHTYTKDGNYTVALTVTASNTCTQTLTKTDLVKISPPSAFFTPLKNGGCKPFTAQFLDSSKSVDPIKTYRWEFGNGDTSGLQRPKYTYNVVGRYKAKLTVTTQGGCMDSFAHFPIKVGVAPKADFTATPLKKCSGDSNKVIFTNLTNTGAIKADSFFWAFGYGGVSYDSFPRDKFHTKPGKYDVQLIAAYNGCPDTMEKLSYVEVLGPYAIALSQNATCINDSITMTDSSIDATNRLWKFDDGATSTKLVASHKFAKAGVAHSVWLVVSSTITGCVDSVQKSISVNPKFYSNFSTKDTFICAPFKVQFKDTSNYNVSVLWDFGNGKKSTAHNPSVQYDTAGSYTVTLTTTTTDTCINTIIKKNYILANRPKVKFTANKQGGCSPIKITFSDSSKSQTPIVKRVWKFGDGTTVSTTSDSISHTYKTYPTNQPGGYSVTLIITDKKGCVDSLVKKVYPTHPKPDLIVTPMIGCYQLDFNFLPVKVDTSGIGPFKCNWDFGDGTSSTQYNFKKVYSKSGNYNVQLKITDIYGCSNSITKSVLIYKEHPKAKLTGSPVTANCPPLVTNFKDSSTPSKYSPITTWTWHFGDGSISHLQHPDKVYALAGKFSVSLVVSDTVGCEDSVTFKDMISIKGPIGSYSFDKKKGCPPLTVNFVGVSKNAAKFTWDMGDGDIVNGPTAKHDYTYSGKFKPSLILIDSTGCKVALPPKDSIQLAPPPKADFFVN
ncbi:MAG: PKD domain-containing protein, partial [Bacteroidetes bacterium]|nr:PKD domain-containing protein [Bacteroidota bacterium]